jgi:hypothetical protein
MILPELGAGKPVVRLAGNLFLCQNQQGHPRAQTAV